MKPIWTALVVALAGCLLISQYSSALHRSAIFTLELRVPISTSQNNDALVLTIQTGTAEAGNRSIQKWNRRQLAQTFVLLSRSLPKSLSEWIFGTLRKHLHMA